MKVIVFRPSSLAMFNSGHWHTGAASVVKVLLWENQPFTTIDGAPHKHENNASSCKLSVKPFGPQDRRDICAGQRVTNLQASRALTI
jgi:hypothetical protein